MYLNLTWVQALHCNESWVANVKNGRENFCSMTQISTKDICHVILNNKEAFRDSPHKSSDQAHAQLEWAVRLVIADRLVKGNSHP